MTINNRARSVVAAILALSTLFLASAWSKDLPIQIKVLSGETRQFQGPPFPSINCEWRDISAYCFNSSPETYVQNTMIVQEPGGKSLEIACTVYNQWSCCTNLPVNQSFQAWRGKRSLKIRYLDHSGKMREQVYEINKVDTAAQP
jgi:hypothetical protein